MKYTLITFLFFVSFLANAQTEPKPYGVLPSERQLKWHETEMYCIIHFTPTTFENKEWGYGDADPKIFNPTDFDANQIVAAAKSGGFKGIIFVAKHHDGFCLWKTKTTDYSIRKSPWKHGKGDMVREFQEACQSNGMKFGVYCSPWDRNNSNYGTEKYLKTYRQQLKELYTNYGDLFMSWHDGANGGDGYYGGKRERRGIDNTVYYDWENTWSKITRKLQPDASIFSDIGWDVRWVGNENGFAAETHWATFTPEAEKGNVAVPGNVNTKTSNEGTRNGKFWIPAECDVPLRKGWFYHPDDDDSIKSAETLLDLYMKSVGRGAGLDLGLSPSPKGQLHENDVKILAEFGEKLKKIFENNLMKNTKISASSVRENAEMFSVENLKDNDRYSYWATDDAVHEATVLIEFPEKTTISLLQLRENIKLGQRVEKVEIELWENNAWKKMSEIGSIGANRLIEFKEKPMTDKLKIRFVAPVALCISEIGVY